MVVFRRQASKLKPNFSRSRLSILDQNLILFSTSYCLKKMEFDPVNNSNGPPSRYLLESDSESEREDEPQVSDQATRNLQDRIKILFQDTDNKSVDQIKDRDLNILLGQAGISWSQSIGSGGLKEDASLLVDGIQVSSDTNLNDPSCSLSVLESFFYFH